jgi:Carboxypeptidase regulatory-like domain
MGIARLFAIATWMVAVAIAQAPRQSSLFAAVSGIVLNDATGTPMRHAAVTLSTVGPEHLEALTFTESSGAFGFSAIPPAKYRLRVEMDGFEDAWFGAGNSKRPPGILTLAAGDLRYGITFRLRPLGSISGTVLDAEGDPVPNASVRLLRASWSRRKLYYRNAGGANADDRGHYHLEDIPAGQYFVMAAHYFQPALVVRPEASAAQPAPQQMYAAEFYPDTTRLSAAAPVQVVPGKELDGIDFHLTTKPVVSLRGKVVVPGDVPAESTVNIAVFPEDIQGNLNQAAGSGARGPEFSFELPNLTPGPYLLIARLSTAGRDYRVAERVDVAGPGQEVALHLERAIDLSGRLDVEGNGQAGGPFKVKLVSGDSPPVGAQPQAVVQPDGSFTIPNVVPGIWDIDVSPIPPGGYLKSMRLGDEDVLTEDMLVAPATHESLRIVVSTRGAVVTGEVTVPQGLARSPRASVLLAPCGKYEHVLSFYAVEAADDSGRFEFKGVTPGHYKLYAFEELEPQAYGDPNFLKPFENLSEAFDVLEGGHVSRQVQLIPAQIEPRPQS